MSEYNENVEENEMVRRNLLFLSQARNSGASQRQYNYASYAMSPQPPPTLNALPTSVSHSLSYESSVQKLMNPAAIKNITTVPQRQSHNLENDFDLSYREDEEGNDEEFANASSSSPSLWPNTAKPHEEEITSSLHELLINAIQNHTSIWKVSSEDYKNKNKKQQAWEEIAQLLSQNVNFLKKEWEKLKDSYRKCCQRREKMTKSGSGTKKLPVCKFYSELSFLQNTVINRKTISNISINESTCVNENIQESDSVKSPVPSQDSQACKKRKSVPNADLAIDAMIVKALSDDKKEEVDTREGDEDRLFCLSLVGMLKQLPNRQKRYIRFKIEELFYNLSEE